MRSVIYTDVSIRNFKGIKKFDLKLNPAETMLCGRNAVGKSSVIDLIWWVLFGKNAAGESNFDCRTLDGDGNKVHFIDIEGVVGANVDGTQYEIKRIQKEKWVKRRGQEDQEFAGNINEYSVNGYPKSEKEFKAFIAEIIDEKTFMILMNPTTFPNLDWKEQRSILMSIVGDVADDDLSGEVEYFDLMKPELQVASIDDIKKKWTKARNDLKKKPDELQTRIDEVESQMAEEVDVAALEAKRKVAIADINALKDKMLDLETKTNAKVDAEIEALESKRSRMVAEASTDAIRNVDAAEHKRKVAKDAWNDAEKRLEDLKRDIADSNRSIYTLETSVTEAEDEVQILKEQTFPEEESICPTCGQALPEKEVKSLREKWEKNRAEKLSEAIDIAATKRQHLTFNIGRRDDLITLIERVTSDIEIAEKNYRTASDEYESAYKASEDARPDTSEIDAEIEKLYSQRIDESEIAAESDKIREQIQKDRMVISDIEREINSSSENEMRRARIADLEKELREVGQRVSNCDKMLYACDSYIKAISRRINDKFDGLEFKLFEQQINGGVKETCSITYDGVPYQSLNSGHRIVVGLNIIKALQEVYGIKVPVVIDNAESISEGNLPDMDCQTILLKVTDDPVLTVTT